MLSPRYVDNEVGCVFTGWFSSVSFSLKHPTGTAKHSPPIATVFHDNGWIFKSKQEEGSTSQECFFLLLRETIKNTRTISVLNTVFTTEPCPDQCVTALWVTWFGSARLAFPGLSIGRDLTQWDGQLCILPYDAHNNTEVRLKSIADNIYLYNMSFSWSGKTPGLISCRCVIYRSTFCLRSLSGLWG